MTSTVVSFAWIDIFKGNVPLFDDLWSQAGIKIAGENINNLMAESKEELKSLLTKLKEESEKAGLKLNFQITKIMASSPITAWQIDGETMGNSDSLFSWAPNKITMNGDCSHEIKTLAPWKKSYDKPTQHTKKQRCHFANKGLYRQRYGFSSHVWMWELDHKEGWVPKNWFLPTVVLGNTLESPLGCLQD